MNDVIRMLSTKWVRKTVYDLILNDAVADDAITQKSFVINTPNEETNTVFSHAFFKTPKGKWEYQSTEISETNSPFYVCPFTHKIFKNQNWETRVRK